MPGHSSLLCADCVNLSAMPGIHVLTEQHAVDVDGRDKAGHDGKWNALLALPTLGRHRPAAPAQPDILQFGKRSDDDRLCRDKDFAQEVRRHHAREQ